jgi:hypothetical protein
MPRDKLQAVALAQKRTSKASQRRPKPTARKAANGQAPVLEAHQMKGDLPPFNDWSTSAIDNESQTIYLYGGCRPGGDISPTADFFGCDMKTLKWKNYTVSTMDQ